MTSSYSWIREYVDMQTAKLEARRAAWEGYANQLAGVAALLTDTGSIEVVLDHYAPPNGMYWVGGRVHVGRIKWAWIRRGFRPGYAHGYRRSRRRHGYVRFPSRSAP